ncbi:MAG: hypothetical protein ACLTTH_15725 [Holdemanella porci]
MQKNLNVRNIEIVDKAKLSLCTKWHRMQRRMDVLAAAVGFVLGCRLCHIEDILLDNRLRNKEEAEKYLGIPCFLLRLP